MSNQPTAKDVIYIDIDDEITAIIDKVRGSDQRIVALVLPKRATAMQSIVNMKLLKRSADAERKHLVLITSEQSLLPLAGNVGLYVAKSLQSRPEIPVVPGVARPDTDADEAEFIGAAATDTEVDRSRPIGDYAGGAAAGAATALPVADDTDDTIELDNAPQASAGGAAGAAAAKAVSAKKDRKLKIPDFNKFRVLLIAGIAGLVLLIGFWYVAAAVLPSAKVTIATDSEAVDSNIDVVFNTAASEVNIDDAVVPAKLQQLQKTNSQSAEATGSLNKGEKARGTVTITNCSFSTATFPAGTGFSANGLTFISKESVSVPISSYTPTQGGFKCNNDGKRTVEVTAQKSGAAYNLAASDYTIANSPENVKASGSAMAGGTDVVVKVVQQSDIDGARQKIAAQDTAAIKAELQTALESAGMFALDGTFATTGEPEITTSVPVGAEADAVAVTQKTNYTMLGARSTDLKKIIASEVEKEIDTDTQTILDYGLEDAGFKIQNQQGTGTLVAVEVTSVAGSDLDIAEIKSKIAGKKASDAKSVIGDYPGVTDVTVKYSPFWVRSIPKKTAKITVIVEKPQSHNANQ